MSQTRSSATKASSSFRKFFFSRFSQSNRTLTEQNSNLFLSLHCKPQTSHAMHARGRFCAKSLRSETCAVKRKPTCLAGQFYWAESILCYSVHDVLYILSSCIETTFRQSTASSQLGRSWFFVVVAKFGSSEFRRFGVWKRLLGTVELGNLSRSDFGFWKWFQNIAFH